MSILSLYKKSSKVQSTEFCSLKRFGRSQKEKSDFGELGHLNVIFFCKKLNLSHHLVNVFQDSEARGLMPGSCWRHFFHLWSGA